MSEIPEDRKGIRLECDEAGQWFAALPNGKNVGAWQKVTRDDLVNMGLGADVLDQIPVGRECAVKFDRAALNVIPPRELINESEIPVRAAEPEEIRALYLWKDGDGGFCFGWGVSRTIYWHVIELADLPYLGFDIRDVESIVPGELYRGRLPGVRLEPV